MAKTKANKSTKLKYTPAESSQTAFNVEILNASHTDIKKLKRQYPTSIHGNKLWGSSFLLMDYFRKHPPQKNCKVLELGCGWALASIYLNKVHHCHVTGIDADSDVFAYANLHATINQAQITTQQHYFEKISTDDLKQYDLIIAADVCFWDELSDIHFKLIRRALDAGITKIIYADPERSPFTTLAHSCKTQLEKEGITVRVEGARVKSLKASGQLLIIEQARA